MPRSRIEACINRIESAARKMHPERGMLFVKPQTAQTWQARAERLAAQDP